MDDFAEPSGHPVGYRFDLFFAASSYLSWPGWVMPAGLPRLADLAHRVLADRLVADQANFFPTLYLHDLAVVHDHFDRTVVDARNGPEDLLTISGDSRLSVCPSLIRFASNPAIVVSPLLFI